MKINKTLKSAIIWILYIAVLIGLIYGIPKGLTYVLDTEYPMATITSGSMWPALKKGDFILIKGIDSKEEIRVGDIVVYKNPSTGSGQAPKGFTIHRVVKMDEDTLVTKGDANNTTDSPIKYEEIIGKPLGSNQKPFRIPILGNIGIFISQNIL